MPRYVYAVTQDIITTVMFVDPPRRAKQRRHLVTRMVHVEAITQNEADRMLLRNVRQPIEPGDDPLEIKRRRIGRPRPPRNDE